MTDYMTILLYQFGIMLQRILHSLAASNSTSASSSVLEWLRPLISSKIARALSNNSSMSPEMLNAIDVLPARSERDEARVVKNDDYLYKYCKQ